MLPAGKQRGTPTGGGNFHIFKRATAEEREAAMKFVKWMTAPQRAAEWAIATGYVAVSPAAWETDTMKKYVADFPAPTVARDQLQYAMAELSTHENQRVTKALNDGLQAALTGTKTPAQAMQDAQREAERILRAYRFPGFFDQLNVAESGDVFRRSEAGKADECSKCRDVVRDPPHHSAPE